MNTRIVIPFSLLALVTVSSAAKATGYFIAAEAGGPFQSGVVGWEGTSTTPITFQRNSFRYLPTAALYDFDGNGIPEVVMLSPDVPGVVIYPDFGAGKPVFLPFDGANRPNVGVITITAPTITVTTGPSTATVTYNPGGTPSLPSPIFDLNGDGIADSVTSGFNNMYVTDGATHNITTIAAFGTPPDYMQIVTWSPAQAPEPASLSLLALAAPLLLKRRR